MKANLEQALERISISEDSFVGPDLPYRSYPESKKCRGRNCEATFSNSMGMVIFATHVMLGKKFSRVSRVR